MARAALDGRHSHRPAHAAASAALALECCRQAGAAREQAEEAQAEEGAENSDLQIVQHVFVL